MLTIGHVYPGFLAKECPLVSISRQHDFILVYYMFNAILRNLQQLLKYGLFKNLCPIVSILFFDMLTMRPYATQKPYANYLSLSILFRPRFLLFGGRGAQIHSVQG